MDTENYSFLSNKAVFLIFFLLFSLAVLVLTMFNPAAIFFFPFFPVGLLVFLNKLFPEPPPSFVVYIILYFIWGVYIACVILAARYRNDKRKFLAILLVCVILLVFNVIGCREALDGAGSSMHWH